MEKICLDYEAALDFLRGEPTILEKLKYYVAREEICVTSPTLFNLLQTIRKPEVMTAFSNRITILPFDRSSAQMAATLAKELDDHGELTKKMEDLITAAICISNDAFLFSRSNSKYDGVKGLRKV
ncbi:type II toxin-antitoxin system VapC family toxin [Candidatus Micrarchaeota archaeon]|nr:type II toxin-antitoxin system VapC family toxin [Candidatus Micrarchaeota archaeon]